MTDEFTTRRDRIETYPTMLEYCLSRDDVAIERLVSDDVARKNIFGSYPGTMAEHARDIITAVRSKTA